MEIGKFESVTQSVLSGVLQIGYFQIRGLNVRFIFPFVRPTSGRQMNMSFFLFQQFMPWEKKN